MLGWALAACAIGKLTVPVAGQTDEPTYPPMTWAAQESLFSHADARDEGMDIVYWKEILGFPDPDRHWVYVTGWVTEMDEDEVVGTRFATYKYDAEFDDNGNPPEPDKFAYFPPTSVSLTPGEEYKAVAMVVGYVDDEMRLYVVGQAPRDDEGPTSDLNYCVISYDRDLVQKETFFYDGPVSGDDIPVDIGWAGGKVVVTGTSPGNGTGKDIATLALKGDTLTLDGDAWPSSMWGGPGERRYNHTVNGDDRAVQLGTIAIASPDGPEAPRVDAVLVGTSWGGPAFQDDYVTLRWGYDGGVLVHEVRYETPLNDVATAITDDGGIHVFVTGYSEVPADSFGPTGPEVQTDYATLGYRIPHAPWEDWIQDWEERWDYADGRDFARDIELYEFSSCPTCPDSRHIWVTGAGGIGGSAFDVATIRYVHEYEATEPLESWSDGWAGGSGWQYGRGLTVVGDEPYIVGAIGSSTSDRMLAVKYEKSSVPPFDPPYEEDWYKTYLGGGAYTGGVNHEARKVLHLGGLGVFTVGVSTVSGEGQQFTTWRYQE